MRQKCTQCGRTRLEKFFYNEARKTSGLGSCCKDCHNKYTSNWKKKNPEKVREARLKMRFGLSLEDYDKLSRHQKGRCAVCDRKPVGRKLSVDHDHKTGKIRGLLCYNCNRNIIGRVTDPDIFDAAALYLYHPPAMWVLGERIVPKKKRRRKHVKSNKT